MKTTELGESSGKAFRTFEDLEVYQAAREFRKAMYRVSRRLPEEEKYGLASQVRRAAVSLTNNIAEGHGRFHFLEQIKFCLQSRGSLQELVDDLNVCNDERYLEEREILLLEATGMERLSTSERIHPLSAPAKRWQFYEVERVVPRLWS